MVQFYTLSDLKRETRPRTVEFDTGESPDVHTGELYVRIDQQAACVVDVGVNGIGSAGTDKLGGLHHIESGSDAGQGHK